VTAETRASPEPVTIEILSADWTGHPWERILDVSLDGPRVGVDEHRYALSLGGWVVGRRRPVSAINVLLAGFPPDGLPLLSVPVSILREGVLRRFEHLPRDLPCGFATTIGVAGLPAEFELTLEAVFDDGQAERFGKIVGRHPRIESHFAPALQPLMLTSLGRTGTTWLMRLLSEHPQLAVHRVYPYETRACAYWMHAFDVLAEPHHHGVAHPDDYHHDRTVVRHSPLHLLWRDPAVHGWLQGAYVEQLAGFVQRTTDSFYQVVAESNGCLDPRYFAEKFHVGHARWFARSIYSGARELLLVRDPRDMLCSILAFNARRGYESFGRELVESDAQFVGRIREDFARLVYAQDSDRDPPHLVRYEDVILDPPATLSELLRYADLDAAEATVAGMLERAATDTAELAAHRTAGDARQSVGRWRRDLSPELQAICADAFGELLERLGYEAA
jgi:hypothetical protein